jgi:hypothetical protein
MEECKWSVRNRRAEENVKAYEDTITVKFNRSALCNFVIYIDQQILLGQSNRRGHDKLGYGPT